MTEAADTPQDDGSLVRGGTLLLAAKGVAVLGGFALYWLLARIFTASLGELAGTAALGTWGATFGVINPLNTVAAAGTLQMMSRLVAQRVGAGGGPGGGVLGRAARTQLVWIGAVFVGLELSAGAIARHVLNDAGYAPALRLAAVIPLFYALRALYEGYLNGTRRFREQAWLDMGATALRLLFVLGAAAAGYGALGAIGGFVAAASCMALVAVGVVRLPHDAAGPGVGATPGVREILAFQAQVIGVTLATQYLLNVDLLAVKALGAADPAVADRLAGYYTAAQKLAQVPLSVGVALSYVMFAYVASDHARSARVVHQGMRVLLLLLVPSAALLAANAPETLDLVFPGVMRSLTLAGDPPGAATDALRWLALLYVPCALFLTSTTLITAGGRPGLAFAIASVTLLGAGVAVRMLTPAHGAAGAALGVGAAWTLGLLLCAAALARRFGALLAARSSLRIALAGGAVAWLAVAVPGEGAWLLAEDLGLALVFLLLLLALREVSPVELRTAWARLRP